VRDRVRDDANHDTDSSRVGGLFAA